MTTQNKTELMDLNDDCISEIAYCLDSRSRNNLRSLNSRLNRIVFSVVEHILRFRVESVILQTPTSLVDMAIRRDPTSYAKDDQVRRDAWVADYQNNLHGRYHRAALFGNAVYAKIRTLFSPGNVFPGQGQYTLEQRIYMDVFPYTSQVFHTNENVYGAELQLHYRKRFDKYVIMHPKSIDFVKDWLEEWKSNEEYNGMLKALPEEDQKMAEFPQERILIQNTDNLRRTILIFTPEPYRSLCHRLVKYVRQNCPREFRIEKMCLSDCLMDWLLRLKCTITSLIIKNCMYTAESFLFGNLLDILQPQNIELHDFGFLGSENPLKESFWKSATVLLAGSISILARQDPPPCYNFGDVIDMDDQNVYVHRFGQIQVDLTKMEFHTLRADVDVTAAVKANQLLKHWQNSSREIRKISLRGIPDPLDIDAVLVGIRKREDRLRFGRAYVIVRKLEEILSIESTNAIEISSRGV